MDISKPNKATANDVIYNATLVYDQMKDRLTADELWLHERGYHKYSAAYSNYRCKIEKALHELCDELEEQ